MLGQCFLVRALPLNHLILGARKEIRGKFRVPDNWHGIGNQLRPEAESAADCFTGTPR